ncbi:MAG: hypothetical protein PHI41_06180 [Erysipelotrichaceae bacterium]|nr:hypothetical protein [Erysipelotrichaceae bacterium]MDD3809529.1 hypothetical protein [Erysipelotrichaceae bacterium]
MLDNKTIVVYGLTKREMNMVERASQDFKVNVVKIKYLKEIYHADYFLAILDVNNAKSEELEKYSDYLENVDPNLATKVIIDIDKKELSKKGNYASFNSFQGIENELSVLIKKSFQKAKRELGVADSMNKAIAVYNYLSNNSGSIEQIQKTTGLDNAEVIRYLGILEIFCDDIQFDNENNSYGKKES